MTHDEVVIARRAIEEGRGLVVIVNKMDLLKEKLYDRVVKAVPEEIEIEHHTRHAELVSNHIKLCPKCKHHVDVYHQQNRLVEKQKLLLSVVH